VLLVNEKVVPKLASTSYRIKKYQIKEAGKKAKDSSIIKDIAIFGQDNRIIYAGSFDTETDTLQDIIIHQNDENNNLIMKLSAESGQWRNGKWVFSNGTAYRLNNAGYMIGSPSPFRRRVMSLAETPKDLAARGKRPEFMNYGELKAYIDRFSKKGSSTTRQLTVDLHYKMSLPFAALVVIFIAAPFAFMVQRGGLLIGIGVSILIGLVFYSLSAVFLAMGKGGLLPPVVSAHLGNVLFLTAGIILIKRCR